MDSGTLAISRKLIIEECANHSRVGPWGISNFCWGQEKKNKGKCLYFGEIVKECGYFKQIVEPILNMKNRNAVKKLRNGR